MHAQRPTITALAVVGLAFLALLSTGTHTVRQGETLGAIALRYGTTVEALAQANELADPDLIIAGDRLTIPGTAHSSSADDRPSYTVREGDTLGSIALRHGTSAARLASLNELQRPNLIRAGQVLTLPATDGTGRDPAPASPAGGATTHVVQAGETVGDIAARYRIPQAQVVEANSISDGRVYVGQRLRLVPTSSASPGAGLVCPVPGGATFMNDWGFPRSGGRFHEGNDLFAPRGRPAVATVAGTVVQAVGRIGGNQVLLHGDDGVTYVYTHLDRFGSRGRVGSGDVVGYVGSTGNAAGGATHVHFEVRPGGGPAVNPHPAVVAACG